MIVLVEFVLRMSFGMALAMLAVDPRQVTSGYYRNNLYVCLGLNFLAALVAWQSGLPVWWWAGAGALAAYVGAVTWLYEAPRAGRWLLAITGLVTLGAALLLMPTGNNLLPQENPLVHWLWRLDTFAGGALLGTVMAAMLLGHWYLNAPGMPLAPLYRLTTLILLALLLRALLAIVGAYFEWGITGWPQFPTPLFLALRWLAGILGVAATTLMARATLAIPNTQSATGILYVAVIGAFLGELVAQLLSAQTTYPV